MQIVEGKKVPSFVATDQEGRAHRIPEDYAGKWLLLYFYPKDDTPGCTKEACTIRDAWADFEEAGIAVLGVSVQGAKSHQKFIEKYQLPFPLLVDEDKKIVEMFGVWRKKKFMGREYMGTERVSFLIDKCGRVKRIYEKVKPAEHAGEVLGEVRGNKSI